MKALKAPLSDIRGDIKMLYRISTTCLILALLAAAAGATTLQDLSGDLTVLYRTAAPSVVEVRAEKPAGSQTSTAVGTGFVIDNSGDILTVGRAVEGAHKVTVKLSDGRTVETKVMGVDPVTDIAVIKAEGLNLKPLKLGDSSALQPGAVVVTINNQAGFANSVSLGVVSGLDRQVAPLSVGLIQISGTIGPGASGGPVFNAAGNVVGVTTAMLSPSPSLFPFNMPNIFVMPRNDARPSLQQLEEELDVLRATHSDQYPEVQKKKLEIEARKKYEGDGSSTSVYRFPGGFSFELPGGVDLKSFSFTPDQLQELSKITGPLQETTRTAGSSGFAVPINSVKAILDQLKSGKPVERAYLGAEVREEDGKIRLYPTDEGPAAKAGVREGDVLVKADGRTFEKPIDFINYVLSLRPGHKMQLVLRRNGETVNLAATLGTRPSEFPSEPKAPQERHSWNIFRDFLHPGIDLEDANITQVAKALSDATGKNVIVKDPDKIKGKVSIHVRTVDIQKTLDTVCSALDCKYRKDGDTYIISPK
jgi:S1-C subfamily serine protease